MRNMGTFRVGCKVVNIADPKKSAAVDRLLVDTGSDYTWLPTRVLERRHGVSKSIMPRRSNKTKKTELAHDDYDLPAELDFSKLKFIGFGLEALETHVAGKPAMVQLDPDVARVFGTSRSVNAVLRGIIGGLSNIKNRRKSA